MLERSVVYILKTWLSRVCLWENVIKSVNPVWVSLPDYKAKNRELEEEDGKFISVSALTSSLLPLTSNGKVGTL